MARIADFLELIVLDLVRRPERPAYVALKTTRPMPPVGAAGRGRPVASLGVMPDYAHEAHDGLSISGVRDGGPAALAGLKGGDLIVKLGDKAIGTIYDYMESMERYKPGDKVDLVVKRDGKDVKLQATLGSRARE
jgi:S1-C subfamily serine protease